MIEIEARGPIKTHEEHRVDKDDGHDRIVGRVTTAETTEVEIDFELPQGHVNIEGFAPSRIDWPMREIFGRFIRDTVDGNFEIVDREWETELTGDYWDWIQQAHRYQTERPYKSLIDCLELFSGWEETNTHAIDEAILQVDEETDYGHTEMGEMSDESWDHFRYQLNQIYEVEIPESYSNDDQDTSNTNDESRTNRQALRSS